MKYCKNCGTAMADEARFCPKCGTQTAAPDMDADSVQKPDPGTAGGPSIAKDKRKLWVTLGCIAAAIILVIVLIAANADPFDYAAAVRELAPFDDDGLYYTNDEVFGYYLSNPSWSVDKTDDGAVVTVSGTARGTSATVIEKTKVIRDRGDDSGWFEWRIESVSAGGSVLGVNEAAGSVYGIFQAYDADIDTLAAYTEAFTTDYMSWTDLTWTFASYSQQLGAAEVVLMNTMEAVAPNLSSLASLAGQEAVDEAVASTVNTISEAFNSASSGTTLGQLMAGIEATLGFLKFLLALS